MTIFCIAFIEERTSVNKSLLHSSKHLYTFPFLQENNAENPHLILIVPPSKQRLHNSQFLKKLSCQKPCWYQARLYILVNKNVETTAEEASLTIKHVAFWSSDAFCSHALEDVQLRRSLYAHVLISSLIPLPPGLIGSGHLPEWDILYAGGDKGSFQRLSCPPF